MQTTEAESVLLVTIHRSTTREVMFVKVAPFYLFFFTFLIELGMRIIAFIFIQTADLETAHDGVPLTENANQLQINFLIFRKIMWVCSECVLFNVGHCFFRRIVG